MTDTIKANCHKIIDDLLIDLVSCDECINNYDYKLARIDKFWDNLISELTVIEFDNTQVLSNKNKECNTKTSSRT